MGTQGKRPAAQVAVLLLMTCVLLHGGESGRKPSAPLKRIPLKALVVGPRTTELETIFEKGSLKDHEILVRWTLSEPAVSMLSTAFEPAPGNSNGWLCRGKWQAKATCSLSVHVSDGTRLLCLNETTTTSGGVQDVSKTKRAAEQEAGKRARIVWAPKELRQVAALALAKKLHTSSVMANYAAGRGRAGGLSLVKCSSGRSAARIRIVIGQGNSDAGARRDRGKLEALSQVLGRAFRTKVADVSVAQDAGNRLWDETIIKVETHSERFPDIEPWVFSFKANVLVSTARDVRRFEAQTSWVHERAGTKMMNSIPVVGGVFGVFAFTGEVLVEIYSLGAVPAAKRRLASRKSVPALAENLFVQIWTDPDFQAFIRDVDEKKTEPAALDLKVSFDDTRGLLPNNRIDAGETCALQVRATNRGEGTAFGVCLKVASSNADVSAQEDMPLGDIVPQGSEQATVSLVATTSLATGTTEFLITAEDRRGFSATPIRLEVPTAAMAPPTLSIDSCAMGDAGGLAKGDGDGTAENGETLELTPCIANSGLGEALQVSVSLCEVTPGIDVVHGQRVLPAVAPGRVGKATLSLCIPRTFADTELRYTIVAKDVRGITARRTFTVPLVARRPGVELSCRILDRQGRAVTRMENGRGFRMIIALRNTGDISAEDVQLEVGSLAEGVTFERQRATVGSLAHNAPSTEMALPVSLDKTFAGDVVRFTVTATQRGFGPAVQEFSFPVRCLRPQLKARITLLGAAGSPMLLQNTRPTLRLSVANNGDLDAAEVAAHVELTHAGIDLDRRVALGTIQAGRECYRDFSFFVRSDAVPGPVTATVVVTQATFPGKSMGFPCRVERQEAIVQRVGGVTTLAVAPPAKRDVPPEIYIVSPNDGATIYAETAALIGTIITFGKDNVPEKLTVALDGRPVSVKRIQQEPGSPVPVDHAYAWPAGEGKTMFRGTLAFNLGRNE
ncbi:MAG: hypothetical protein HOJ57_22270, partial [Lentisphaerae bacterium]|nr:hypothetical protein [Lentisphaerota bacterium]